MRPKFKVMMNDARERNFSAILRFRPDQISRNTGKLAEEECTFKKLDQIIADVTHAPLKHQRENYVLNELLESRKTVSINQ